MPMGLQLGDQCEPCSPEDSQGREAWCRVLGEESGFTQNFHGDTLPDDMPETMSE